MSSAFPSLVLTLVFCMVANSFGEWYAERVNLVPEVGGRLSLIVAAVVVLALAAITIA